MVRESFTTAQAKRAGVSAKALRYGVQSGKWVRVDHNVYMCGSELPSELDRMVAIAKACNGVLYGRYAGSLHALDIWAMGGKGVIVLRENCTERRDVRRVDEFDWLEINGVACTSGLQTVCDLASMSSDEEWEQVLESALRQNLFKMRELEDEVERLGRKRQKGVGRMRRVLSLRPEGAPATGSRLETIAVQLIRSANLPTPKRQVEIRRPSGEWVGQPDLCWPDLGVFVELDGEWHKDQPTYDSSRETSIVGVTGWLPARFTWHEAVVTPSVVARRIRAVLAQAQRRVSIGESAPNRREIA